MTMFRSRWAAIGAAIAVTLGAGGIGLVSATTPSDAATFVPITPCRVIDTRPDFQVGARSAPLAANDTHDVTATGNSGECTAVPASATGVVLNVTTVDATLETFITIWETGQPRPNASSLNPTPGAPPTPNAVTTAINGSGQFSIYNLQGTVHVLADIAGYYTDHHHDDRYYTKAQTNDGFLDQAEGDARYLQPGQADDSFLDQAEGDARYLQPGQAAAPPQLRSRWTGCNGPSMTAGNNDYDTFIITNNIRGYIGSNTNGTRLYCQLEVPNGAQLNGFRALFRDTGPSGSGQGLARCFLYAMPMAGPDAGNEINLGNTVAATGLLGTNGAETPILVTDPMPSIPVDTEANVYFIKCDLFNGGITDVNDLGIYAAQVRYNFVAVPGTDQ